MRPENLLKRLDPTQKCTLGCPILDSCLNGGVPCNSITEIVAESGSGKTQLCLQLSLCAQLPISHGGLFAAALYLHTEFPFALRRLRQLSDAFQAQYPEIFINNGDGNNSNFNDPCDNIFVQSVHSAHHLFDIMPRIKSFLINSKTHLPVRLIVIDSVAALFRSEFENTPTDLKRRSSLFFKISSELKALATRFNLAVVVSNQVVDIIGSGNGLRIGNLGSLCSSGRGVCPALGLAWANCVNSRLFLSRDENCSSDGGGSGGSRRRLHVVFAPHLPYSYCEFVIRREGAFGVDR